MPLTGHEATPCYQEELQHQTFRSIRKTRREEEGEEDDEGQGHKPINWILDPNLSKSDWK